MFRDSSRRPSGPAPWKDHRGELEEGAELGGRVILTSGLHFSLELIPRWDDISALSGVCWGNPLGATARSVADIPGFTLGPTRLGPQKGSSSSVMLDPVFRPLRIALLAVALLASAGVACAAQERVSVASPRGAPDLETILMLQRVVFPSATISGSFYEWRDVSKYRSVAGMHLGYDIAMPAGTPAVAGWPGQVTRVQPWYGIEHGVTVLSPSGYEATYGHISPRVKVGDVLNAGDTVGLVAVDHVDVKMRGPDGLFFDFGHATPPVAGLLPMPLPLRPTRADALRLYEMAWYSVQLDQEELRQSKVRQAQAQAALADARSSVHRARGDLPRLRSFLDEGLVARVEVEKAEADAKSGASRITLLQTQLRDVRRDVAALDIRVRATRSRLEAVWAVLAGMGLSRADVERRLRAPSSPQAVAQARELKQMRDHAREHKTDAAGMAAARAEAERMETLFSQGVVSRSERDRARARYDALRQGN